MEHITCHTESFNLYCWLKKEIFPIWTYFSLKADFLLYKSALF